jgi:hypothetical protein
MFCKEGTSDVTRDKYGTVVAVMKIVNSHVRIFIYVAPEFTATYNYH